MSEEAFQVSPFRRKGYEGLPNHASVCHSAGKFVNGQIHTKGVESFWSMLKRAHRGTFHKIS